MHGFAPLSRIILCKAAQRGDFPAIPCLTPSGPMWSSSGSSRTTMPSGLRMSATRWRIPLTFGSCLLGKKRRRRNEMRAHVRVARPSEREQHQKSPFQTETVRAHHVLRTGSSSVYLLTYLQTFITALVGWNSIPGVKRDRIDIKCDNVSLWKACCCRDSPIITLIRDNIEEIPRALTKHQCQSCEVYDTGYCGGTLEEAIWSDLPQIQNLTRVAFLYWGKRKATAKEHTEGIIDSIQPKQKICQ